MTQRLSLWLVLLLTLVLPPALLAQTDITCETLAPADSPAAYFIGLGDAFRTQGDYSRAIVSFTCAIELEPAYVPAYVSRGVAHVAQFNYPQAMSDYNLALELDSNFVAAYNNRGIVYALQANFGLAIADFSVAALLTPDDPAAFNNRALIHAAEGNFDLALEDAEEALLIAPDYPPAHATLGAIHLALAAQSYSTYADLTANAPVPNGDAQGMLAVLQAGQEIGDSSAWMSFMVTQ